MYTTTMFAILWFLAVFVVRISAEEQICNHGTALEINGEEVYCGKGGTPCPVGYECNIHPTDLWAVCCPLNNRRGVCGLPVDPGPCKALMPRWYYDALLDTCKLFNYGGCQGNKNNFLTQEKCEKRCQICDPVLCRLYCEYGFKLDNKGCEICECNKCSPAEVDGCIELCKAIDTGFIPVPGEECSGCPCQDVCYLVDCPDGQTCTTVQVQCFRAPCPPQAVCRDILD